MGTRTLPSGLLLLPALLVTGCLHEPDVEVAEREWEPPAEVVVQRDVTMKWQRPDADPPVAPALAASPKDRWMPDPVPFRIGAGHGALGLIDLSPCRALGLPAGYLAMRVTFHRDGRVARAVVEGPVPPPEEALDCVAQQIQGASVPLFDGKDASLTKRFFVAEGGGALEPGDTIVRQGGKTPRPPDDGAGAGLTRR